MTRFVRSGPSPASAAGFMCIVMARAFSCLRPASPLRPAALVTLLALVCCTPPLQNGGVELFEGAEARLQTMCKWRRGEGLPDSCFAQVSGAPAKAFVIEDESVLLRGPHALGQPGDVMLDNGEIAVVIAAVSDEGGPLAGGGVLIDAGDSQVRVDQLSVLAPTITRSSDSVGVPGSARGWVADGVALGSESDGVAWVEVRGHFSGSAPGRVLTRYALAPGSRALQMSTTTEAGQGQHQVGDEVHWGSAIPAPAGSTLDAVGSAVGYSLIPRQAWSDGRRDGAFSRVRASDAHAYHRFLAVSVRGDTLALASELTFLGGGALGALSVGFVDAAGRPVASPKGGTIALTRKSAPPLGLNVAGARRETAPNVVEAEAPVGRYLVSYRSPSGRSERQTEVRIVPGETAHVVLSLQSYGHLQLRVSDGAGVLVSVTAVDTGEVVLSSEPVFGVRDVPMPPGRYRIEATRGLEHTRLQREVELAPGRQAVVELALARSIEPARLVGCEILRGALFGFESSSIGARLRKRLATGPDCLIVTEHGATVDVAPILKSLGASHLPVVAAVESRSIGALGLPVDSGHADAARGTWARLAIPREVVTPEHRFAPGLWNPPSTRTGAPPGLPAVRLYVEVDRDVVDHDAADHDEADHDEADHDEAGALHAGELRRALLAGRGVVLTRGPLLRAEMHDVQIGGVASLRGVEDRLRLSVQRAPWVTIDRVDVLVDGEVRLTLSNRDALSSNTTSQITQYEVEVSREAGGATRPRLTIESDAAVTFLVHGRGHGSSQSDVIASTAPLWIDADADGRALGHLAKKQVSSWRIPEALSD